MKKTEGHVNKDAEIVTYVRDPRTKQYRGVVIARWISMKGYVGVGWSFVNTSLGDSFDKELGKKIARNRCETPSSKEMPYAVRETYKYMTDRAARYFKVSEDFVCR